MYTFSSLNESALAELINDGGVGVLLTDTVFGLVCSANNRSAVQKLYGLKKRENKPGTIIAADINQLVALGIRKRYLMVVDRYWPGPVSVIVPAEDSLKYLHAGTYSIACRIPKQPTLIKLLKKTGPLLTSSANHPGKPPASTIAEAKAYFGNKVDFYVKGEANDNQLASTIIRIVDDAVEVIRQGAVTIDEESGRIVS